MVAELVSVGTGILNGMMENVHARFLAQQCAGLGLEVHYQTVVDGVRSRIEAVMQAALDRAELVIVSGESQDMSLIKEVCVQVLGCEQKQMLVLSNDNGAMPGYIAEKDGRTMILLPGTFEEMSALFLQQVLPYLQASSQEAVYTRVVKVRGMNEEEIKAKLSDLLEHQNALTIRIYAGNGEVHLRVMAKGAAREAAKAVVKPVVKEIKHRLGDCVYATKEKTTLEKAVVKLLEKFDLRVTTAESCTGGLLAGRLLNVPGASEVFKEGFITYSNKAKRKYLDVDKNTLKKYTAVSAETAREMAIGGVLAANCDACVAVTGLAGPDGGTQEQPVGLVYIATYMKESVRVQEYHFKGNREAVRKQAVEEGLELLRRSILENYQ